MRSYEQALQGKLLPALGRMRVSSITRNVVQDLVDGLVADGYQPSTVRNAVLPLRAIFRRLVSRSEVIVNPTLGLELPAYRGRRERVARPDEARALVDSLPEVDRAVWATALYAGLRRGELRGLRWRDVDFETGLIRVERGWDDRVGPIATKSRAGERRVPLPAPLRVYLLRHRLWQNPGAELVFANRTGGPLSSDALVRRSRRSWSSAGLAPIGLHECRHTYASFMIAAGVNAKALSTYMGHSTITITLDRYGHLMPGNEGEAAGMLATYLERERG
ncbi:MAG: site-specific integrase [Polyangiaceae bacterium]|nr:site-specific integrase [Polyangiaceae bacterium]